jgi:hypothetical protein
MELSLCRRENAERSKATQMTYEGKPLSFRPMKFKQAIQELLKAKPEPKTPKAKPKRKAKRVP